MSSNSNEQTTTSEIQGLESSDHSDLDFGFKLGYSKESDSSSDPSGLENVALKHYRELGVTEVDITNATQRAETLSLSDSRTILADFLDDHSDDMLIPQTMITRVQTLLFNLDGQSPEKNNHDIEKEICMEAAVLSGNSVYSEVRAVCDPFDDPNIPVGTIRAWTLGIFWAMTIAAINQFFDPRQPSIQVSVYIVQILVYPMGKFWERTMPEWILFRGTRWEMSFNPGRFSQKEHMLVTIMSNVTAKVPYVSEFIFVQRLPLFFGQEWAGSFGYQICFMLSTQLMGYGFAGMCRRFLVYPPNMVWYLALGQTSLNKAFHTETNVVANGWKISRLKFFMIALFGMFVYFWLPNSLFKMLTFFNWTTWIKSSSAALSIVTGTYYFNFGLTPLGSLDWNWISAFNPLVVPSFIIFQIFTSMFLWGVLVILPVFFTNTWWTGHLPINSFLAYSNIGKPYDVTQIMNGNFEFVQEKYEAYSPVFLSAAPLLRYGILLATYLALITYTGLWHGKVIKGHLKKALRGRAQLEGFTDVHSRLMRVYKEVPEYIYLFILAIATGLGFATIFAWPTDVPGWTIPFGIILTAFFIIPFGMVTAITAYEPDLEIISQIVGSIACAGRPIATAIFRSYGTTISIQAISFVQDMKLGHYAKIPPRQMLACQIVATFLSSFVTIGIIHFQLYGIEGICTPDQKSQFICSGANSQFVSAIQWGLIGPKRLFAKEGLYNKLLWFIPAGALWPIPFWLAKRKWPGSWVRYCHPIAMLMGGVIWAPWNLSNTLPGIPISWFFGSYIKKRFLPWWSKYTYVLAAALTAGVALSAIVQFFALEFHPISINWWGNSYPFHTCDWNDCRYIETDYKKGERFGPAEWH